MELAERAGSQGKFMRVNSKTERPMVTVEKSITTSTTKARTEEAREQAANESGTQAEKMKAAENFTDLGYLNLYSL